MGTQSGGGGTQWWSTEGHLEGTRAIWGGGICPHAPFPPKLSHCQFNKIGTKRILTSVVCCIVYKVDAILLTGLNSV